MVLLFYRSYLKKRDMVQGRGKIKKITGGNMVYFEDWLFGFDKEIGTYNFFAIASNMLFLT